MRQEKASPGDNRAQYYSRPLMDHIKEIDFMSHSRTKHRFSLDSHLPLAIACLSVIGVTCCPASAQQFGTLVNFNGKVAGATPLGGLIADTTGRGVYYTTTSIDGKQGFGTVEEVVPPTAPGAPWTLKELHEFTNNGDGGGPNSALVQDSMGDLFGVANTGGPGGGGTLFEMMPPTGSATTWKLEVLHSFTDTAPNHDINQPILDMQGNIFSSTYSGGANSDRTVFRLVRPMPGATDWQLVTIHTFSSSSGVGPEGALTPDAHGNLYGVCAMGGKYGGGSVYMLTPPASGTTWGFHVLHFFGNEGDGQSPDCTLTIDANGNLFGTTTRAGGNPNGTIFRLSPPAAGMTTWKETILHHFAGGDGSDPVGGLFLDPNGNLFGTTEHGGPSASSNGVFFELSPPSSGSPDGAYTVLHAFTGADGSTPIMTPLPDNMGNLLGTTSMGGVNGFGTVFSLTP